MVLIWDFRLERTDERGQPLPRLSVEMRGSSFRGSIANGDVIEVDAPASPGQLIQPSKVRNVTAGTVVTATGAGFLRASKWIGLVLLLVFAAVFIFVASTVFGGAHGLTP
jgi:hypothetical protein